jgi:predicted transcriptional regulator
VASMGDLERAVMTVLWDSADGASAQEIRSALDGPELAVTTVLTVLTRLTRKGLVVRSEGGRAHRYFASRPRAEFLSELMTEALQSTDDRGAVLAKFLGSIGPEDTDVLRGLLRRRRG